MKPQPQAPPAALLRAGLWIAIVAVPLAWSSSLWAGYTLPKLLLTACAVLLCGIGLLQRPPAGKPQGLTGALVFCAFAVAVTTFASRDYFTSFVGRYNSYALGLCALLLYAAVYTAAANLTHGAKDIPRLIVAMSGLLGAHAVLQRLGIDPFPPMAQLQQHRAVFFSKYRRPHLDHVGRRHGQEVPVVRRMVQLAQREPVRDDRFAVGLGVPDDVRRVEQLLVPQSAQRVAPKPTRPRRHSKSCPATTR